ncbi:hypothetical protein Xgly_01915 [Xanthomonas citri pv. glycines]|uniref:MFS transporter n=2 Tax=Xanthomonas TaxID=338 RepID=A0AAX0HVL3_XANCG|nr:hypothetical protein BHE84_21790 [Xanthomonas citri pv. glycines str. 8ra]ARV21588.1 hypothetical protein A9D66_02945 [Xanthomonas citri pv. glycines str. 12-2]OEY88293.1 hypothetical protein BIY41_02900 [Xanthomonas citri pv. glycines]QTK35229.1 hypothetical protein XcgCFBP2526_02890 [Xanthomonas citri pv. glycines CFBP 2526]EWC50914.1 hypothetical protein XAR_1897 [Xanthomonas citri pv. glycines str. 8ra]
MTPQDKHMPFIDAMHMYFRGEKIEAIYFIAVTGLLLVIFGVAALKAERGGYAWSVVIPSILFGIVLVGVGAGVGLRTDKQVAAIESGLQESPSMLVQKELPRMQKVNANFRMTYYVLGLVAALGLILHYVAGPEWGRGLGSTLVLLGAIGLLIDGFAERRAVPYTAALVRLDAEHRHADRAVVMPVPNPAASGRSSKH